MNVSYCVRNLLDSAIFILPTLHNRFPSFYPNYDFIKSWENRSNEKPQFRLVRYNLYFLQVVF